MGFSPVGTALGVELVVLVELERPWPKPVFAHPVLAGLRSAVFLERGAEGSAARPALMRVLATEPRRGAEVDAGTLVTVFERLAGAAGEGESAGTARVEFRVAAGSGLRDLIAALTQAPAHEVAEQGDWDYTDLAGSRPAVLICTQSTHDSCCGTFGTRLADELEADELAADESGGAGEAGAGGRDFEIFRVSHLGGHRFAPTAITFPNGRMWANLDAATLRQIVSATNSTAGDGGDRGGFASIAQRCRGWWGAAEGPEQVAEQAVFAQVGFELDNHERHISCQRLNHSTGDPNSNSTNHSTAVPSTNSSAAPVSNSVSTPISTKNPAKTNEVGATWRVDIDTAQLGSWTAQVRLCRLVPTIACESAGGLPAKTAQEYEVVSLEQTRPSK